MYKISELQCAVTLQEPLESEVNPTLLLEVISKIHQFQNAALLNTSRINIYVNNGSV